MGRFVSVLALTLGVSLAENIDDGYIPAPNVGANVGDPAMMQGYLLKDAAITDNAVCLGRVTLRVTPPTHHRHHHQPYLTSLCICDCRRVAWTLLPQEGHWDGGE